MKGMKMLELKDTAQAKRLMEQLASCELKMEKACEGRDYVTLSLHGEYLSLDSEQRERIRQLAMEVIAARLVDAWRGLATIGIVADVQLTVPAMVDHYERYYRERKAAK